MKRSFPSILSISQNFTAILIGTAIWSSPPELMSKSDSITETIWFNEPGNDPTNTGLPIGNGRMGMLIPGQVTEDRIVLNEDSVWSGHYCKNANNPAAAASLGEIRQLLFDGKVKEANELILKTQVSGEQPNDPRVGSAYGTYQILAALQLSFPHQAYTNYRRELDLESGLVQIDYDTEDVHYTREFLSSFPDQVMAIRISTDQAHALNFKIALKRPQSNAVFSNPTPTSLLMEGQMEESEGAEGLKYAALLSMETVDGSISIEGGTLDIANATNAIIRITAATNYAGVKAWPNYLNDNVPAELVTLQMQKAYDISWEDLRNRHVQDFSALFNRSQFELGIPDSHQSDIPTSERLQRAKNGEKDDVLTQIYFNLGKYLLIASSRPGDLAANLQGIWADSIWDETTQTWNYFTPWNGDYHTNINVQMNYWPSEVLNLPECTESLRDLIEGMVKPGSETTRIQHNCNGWTVHTIYNTWGSTVPGGWATWGHFVMAGPWMTAHLWEHYLYTQDATYLKSVWPTIRDSAAFVMDWLVKDPKSGLLVSGPSASPENEYALPDGTVGYFCMAPTMDQMIAWQILNIADSAQKVLFPADQQTDIYPKTISQIKGPQIGPDGRLLEWAEPYDEPVPGHRHISHLYGLHPGNQITLDQTPELAEACRKTLEYRLAHGGGHTGWSRAWIINFWARLQNGNEAYNNFADLLAKSTLPNLFDTHPPFQIDGNFGATAGICEMLLQSHETDAQQRHLLRLLPALPTETWPDGRVSGLMARGAIEVDLDWAEGKLVRAKMTSKSDQEITIAYAGNFYPVKLRSGQTEVFKP